MKKIITTKGFSLVEMLVYIAVLVMISTAVVSTYLSLDSVLARNQTERAVTKAAAAAMEHMLRDIRAASTVNTAERSLPDELAVDRGLSTTTEFYLVDERIYVDVNDQTIGPITPEEVSVSDLTFDHHEHTGTSLETEAVRISFTIAVETKSASTTRTFYSSAVLRDSYE